MRRRGKKGNAARERALAEMASARKGGSRRTSQYEVQSEGDVFDLVDEKQYAKLVEDRRKRGDFVVDDDGTGYSAFGTLNPQTKSREPLKNSPHDGFRGRWPMAWPEATHDPSCAGGRS